MPLLHPATRRGAAVLVTLGNVACYSYLPPRNMAELPGNRASLALTDSGSVVLAPRIGQGITAIEGMFLGDSAGQYLIAMLVTRQRNGAEADWQGEHVVVAHSLVTSVEIRAFSAPRSLFAGALATIGVAALTTALRGKGDNGSLGSGTGGKPGTQ